MQSAYQFGQMSELLIGISRSIWNVQSLLVMTGYMYMSFILTAINRYKTRKLNGVVDNTLTYHLCGWRFEAQT